MFACKHNEHLFKTKIFDGIFSGIDIRNVDAGQPHISDGVVFVCSCMQGIPGCPVIPAMSSGLSAESVRSHKKPSGTLPFQIKNVISHPFFRYGSPVPDCCGQPDKASVRMERLEIHSLLINRFVRTAI